MLTLPMLIVLPVQTRRASGGSAMVCPAAYSNETAVKIENVPRVTMNGGRFSRVTSVPLSSPVSSPTARPISRAISPGTPWSWLSLTITSDDSTIAIPMDRSMPAVRMITVCPTARAPTTAICWTSRDRACGRRKLSATMPKTTTARISTINGLSAGLPCRTCWSRCRGVCRVGTRSSAETGASAVCDVSPFIVCSSARPLSSARRAPARLLALVRGLAVDPWQGLGGDELGARVQVVLAPRKRRRLLSRADLGDRVDAELRHLAGVLGRVSGKNPVLHVGHPLAASVDGDYERLVLVVVGLERGVGTLAGGLVDRVDDVDVGVAGQALLHGRAAAVDGALGRLVAGDRVAAARTAVVGSRAVFLGVERLAARIDAHPGEEAVVSVDVDGDHLVVVQVEHGDDGLLAVERGRGVLTDQLAGLEVVGRVGDVRGLGRVERGVEGDHEQAGGLGLAQRRVDGRAVGGDQDALVASG